MLVDGEVVYGAQTYVNEIGIGVVEAGVDGYQGVVEFEKYYGKYPQQLVKVYEPLSQFEIYVLLIGLGDEGLLLLGGELVDFSILYEYPVVLEGEE